MRRTVEACACWSIGGGSEERAHRVPRRCDFDLSEPERWCCGGGIDGDWRARGRDAATEVLYGITEQTASGEEGLERVQEKGGGELGEDGPHTRTAAPS